MITLIQNILFSKEFLACSGYFALFTKIKRGLGLGFGADFLHDFSIKMFYKNVPYLILYQWTKIQCQTLFPSQDIKPNMLSSCLDS